MLRGIAIGATGLASFIALYRACPGVGSNAASFGATVLLAFVALPALMLHMWKPLSASSKCPGGKGLYPECLFRVTVSPSEVRVTHPERPAESVAISDLSEVQVITDDSGPFAADVWWLLLGRGAGTGCSFPGGATGANDVLGLVQALPGFKNEVLIQAMGSTSNARFTCWRLADRA